MPTDLGFVNLNDLTPVISVTVKYPFNPWLSVAVKLISLTTFLSLTTSLTDNPCSSSVVTVATKPEVVIPEMTRGLRRDLTSVIVTASFTVLLS